MTTATKSYKGIYAMHKYWGKKPFDVVSSFITEYTKPGDVVLDSFAGSGVTAIEALRCGRKAIAFDINPVANMLTRVSLDAVDIKALNLEFDRLSQVCKDRINELYQAKCPLCGNDSTVTHIVWNENTPLEVWYKCDGCGKQKIIRKPTEADVEASNNPPVKPLWYPDQRMIANGRINVAVDQKIEDLFTKRALVGLSFLFDEIKKIENEQVREVFLTTFTGALSQASNLVFVIRRRGKASAEENTDQPRAEVGSWVIGYWLPEEHFEINAWNCFENRFRRVLKGKKEVNELFSDNITYCSNFDELQAGEGNVFVGAYDAQSLPLPDDSIDYVFFDPPHAKRIMYLEQSMIWNSWLVPDSDIAYESEIIISDSHEREKTSKRYYAELGNAISELQRVLKPGCKCSIAFNSLKDRDWSELLNEFLVSGFTFCEVKPLEYSATSVVQDNRKNALKTDFVITWEAASSNSAQGKPVSLSTTGMLTAIDSLLQKQPLQTYEVINALFVESLQSGFLYPPAKIVAALNENYSYVDNKWQHEG